MQSLVFLCCGCFWVAARGQGWGSDGVGLPLPLKENQSLLTSSRSPDFGANRGMGSGPSQLGAWTRWKGVSGQGVVLAVETQAAKIPLLK